MGGRTVFTQMHLKEKDSNAFFSPFPLNQQSSSRKPLLVPSAGSFVLRRGGMFTSIDFWVKLQGWMPATPVADCVTVGRLLTSLCLFLLICEVVLVVVCGHLLGLSWSSQEACVWNPQCGVLHHQVQSQCKVTFAVFTTFSLASGQRPVGAPKEGLFIYCSRLFPSRRPAWVARPLRSLPHFQKPTVRAAFTYPLPGCWICHLVWAYLFRAPILSLRILDLMRWEQFEGRDDFRMRIKLGARSND